MVRELADDGIDVAVTMTTRACPLGEMILEEARAALAARFPDVPQISVALVWEPPWSREMMTTRGQELLGM